MTINDRDLNRRRRVMKLALVLLAVLCSMTRADNPADPVVTELPRLAHDGDFAGVLQLLRHDFAASDDPQVNALIEDLDRHERNRQDQESQRREGYDAAIKEMSDLAANGDIEDALISAVDAHGLTDNPDALLKNEAVAALVFQAEAAATQAEAENDWVEALTTYRLLDLLYESPPRYRDHVQRAGRHVQVMRMYVPDELRRLYAERAQRRGDDKPDRLLLEDEGWQIKLKGIDEAMLRQALAQARQPPRRHRRLHPPAPRRRRGADHPGRHPRPEQDLPRARRRRPPRPLPGLPHQAPTRTLRPRRQHQLRRRRRHRRPRPRRQRPHRQAPQRGPHLRAGRRAPSARSTSSPPSSGPRKKKDSAETPRASSTASASRSPTATTDWSSSAPSKTPPPSRRASRPATSSPASTTSTPHSGPSSTPSARSPAPRAPTSRSGSSASATATCCTSPSHAPRSSSTPSAGGSATPTADGTTGSTPTARSATSASPSSSRRPPPTWTAPSNRCETTAGSRA